MWVSTVQRQPVCFKVGEEPEAVELKILSSQVNLTLQMKIVEQEKEIQELRKQLSLLSQDKGVKGDMRDGGVPV